jgi:hypothetical protein
MATRQPQKTSVPAVPGHTVMFEDPAGKQVFPWNLTRTWWIFFERLGRSDSQIQSTIKEVGPKVIGWDLQDCTVGLDVSDPVIPVAQMEIASCRIRIKVTDVGNPLQIDIRRNGTSIFAFTPIIAAGTSARTVLAFTSFVDSPPIIAPDDDVVIDIVQGGSWEVAVYLVSR